jgi:glycosyltransferase involved in cell wall biosynthesis
MDKPQKPEAVQIKFFQDCLGQFAKAATKGTERRFFHIADTTVCLSFAGQLLLPQLTPALDHLRIEPVQNPDFTIHAWDTLSTGVNAPPPPCEWADFTDRGDIWGFNSQRIKTAFHWSEYSVNVMDTEANTGVYWVKNPKTFPYWVASSPFRSMIQWWMEKNGGQLLHAAAVGTQNGAVLITGKGGTGKSTSALTCLNAGMKYLGDDYVIVKNEPEPKVFSLYNTAKVMVEDMHRFPNLKRLTSAHTAENQEKDVLYLYPGLKDQIVNELPLRAILTPKIQQNEETRIEPASFWPIQRAMSFTTMSQLPGVGAHTQQFINEFIQNLPCFTLMPGRNLGLIPKTITDFLQFPEKYSLGNNPSTDASEKPLISIIIPVYNGEKFIQQAIDNILSQQYPAIEIIMVDDGSTDNSREVIESLSVDVRYFHQPNSGPGAARNRGIRDVSGQYIAFLDVDDLWPAKNLEFLMNELTADPELEVVRGFAQLFREDENGNREFLGSPKESFQNYIGAGIYRKSAFEKVGLYDPELRFGEDGDWFNRAGEQKIKMKRLEEITLLVKRHSNNMTKGKSLVELNTLKVFRKQLERKRTGKADATLSDSKPKPSETPLISVIIPVYNGAAFINDAVQSAFNQDYRPLEVIIIDDGSTDNTAEIVELSEYPVKYFRQEKKGVAAARNKGMEKATGRFVAFLDADDIWDEKKLSRQYTIISDKPKISAVIGHTFKMPMSQNVDTLGETIEENKIFILSPGAGLFRKSAFTKVGNFDETLQCNEDIDWFLRAREAQLQIIIHKEVVQFFRMHGKNVSNNQQVMNLGLLRVHKKSLDRRRKSGQGSVFQLPKLNNAEDVLKFWQRKD